MRILNDTQTTSQSSSLSQRDKLNYGISVFGSLGLNRTQALGALGSLAGESGRNLNTSAFNPKDPGTGSYGIGQWNSERRTALENFAASKGKEVSDYRTQVDFIAHELQTTESRTLTKMKAATTLEKASDVWTKSYERPAAATAGYSRRQANARHFAGLLDGTDTTEVGSVLNAYTDPQVSTAERDSQANKAAKAAEQKSSPFDALFGNVSQMTTDISNQFSGEGKDPGAPVNHTVDHLGAIFGTGTDKNGVGTKSPDEAKKDSGFFGETTMGAMIGSVVGGLAAGPIGSLVGGLAGQGISMAIDRMSDYSQTAADAAVTQGSAGGVGRAIDGFFGGLGNMFSSQETKQAMSEAENRATAAAQSKSQSNKNGTSGWATRDSNGNAWSGQAQRAINDSKSKGGAMTGLW